MGSCEGATWVSVLAEAQFRVAFGPFQYSRIGEEPKNEGSVREPLLSEALRNQITRRRAIQRASIRAQVLGSEAG